MESFEFSRIILYHIICMIYHLLSNPFRATAKKTPIYVRKKGTKPTISPLKKIIKGQT